MKKNGFSLVEVMIAVAVSGLTVLATSQLMSSFYRFQRYLEATASYNQFLNEVQMMVDNEANCSISFSPYTLNSSTITNTPTRQDIGLTVGGITYPATGNPYLYNNPQLGVRLKRISIVREPSIAGIVENLGGGVAGTTYVMKLRVEGELDRPNIRGPSIKSRDYSLNLKIRDSNRRIQGCETDVTGVYCKQMGGEWNPLEPNIALRCNLGAVFGGCIQSGGFSMEENSGGSVVCTEVHPDTGQCKCPDGYTPNDAMSFVAGGGKSSLSIYLYGCYRCASTVLAP